MKQRAGSLKRQNIDQYLVRLTKNKRERTQKKNKLEMEEEMLQLIRQKYKGL